MTILIDTDALVAIAKEDDSNHQKALTITRKIKHEKKYVSVLTIPETVTVISHRLTQKAAADSLKNLRQRDFGVLPWSEEVQKLADEFFLKQEKKGTSWPDCLNMALMRKYRLDAIFSFDKIYAENGFNVVK